MEYIFYSLICLLATTLGAISGIGGGVIIKPVFDATVWHRQSMYRDYTSSLVHETTSMNYIKHFPINFHQQQIILNHRSIIFASSKNIVKKKK